MFWFNTYIIIISIESKGRKKMKIKKNRSRLFFDFEKQ